MSVQKMDTVIAAIEQSTLKIASTNPSLAKQFAVRNNDKAWSMARNLFASKRQIDFTGPVGENMNSIAADAAKIVAYNTAIDAKVVALDKLVMRLETFATSGRFEK